MFKEKPDSVYGLLALRGVAPARRTRGSLIAIRVANVNITQKIVFTVLRGARKMRRKGNELKSGYFKQSG
jgi:hypothetical protein